MLVIKGLHSRELLRIKKSVVTLGVFDGVHLGHQKILKQAVSSARKIKTLSIALTFETHPRKTTHRKAPPILTTMKKKAELIAATGIDVLVVVDFDKKFASMTAEAFIEKVLVGQLKIKKAIIGHDYRFGKGKTGDEKLLQTEGRKYGFTAASVSAKRCCGGRIMSSTEIRKAVMSGDMKKAERMIGRKYSITGEVIHGDSRGSLLGFPTANIDVHNEVIPVEGVYAVGVVVSGRRYGGVCNISRPTFDKKNNLIPEIFIFNFKKRIYGKEIEVFFVKKIRESIRFHKVEDLVLRIEKDIIVAKKLLKNRID
ncbi:MAG: bifunctional riboflavin kinase/FAD synthetase [Candidatus Firestonebacteria bacterium]